MLSTNRNCSFKKAVAAMRIGRLARFDSVVLGLLVIGVMLAWTPSSYGLVLNALGLHGTGLIAGTPRAIRSDEWAIWTPFIQIAVRNGFARYDAISIYGEDLRNFNGLPLWDWGLPFKPEFWPFFVIPPAQAFSFYHLLWVAAFLIGWRRALVQLRVPYSAPLSILLLFTGYAQFWWTTTGPQLAIFPWILIIVLSDKMRYYVRFPALAWTTAVWLLAFLYPPVILSLVFAGAMLVIACRPGVVTSARALIIMAGCATGVLITWLYLQDSIQTMASTVYPGQRSLGGGSVLPAIFLTQYFPFLLSDDTFQNLSGLNICEVGTGGSYLPLLVAVFCNHREGLSKLLEGSAKSQRIIWMLLVLIAGYSLIAAWMLLPIPAAVGRLLLWNTVPPIRMMFAASLLMHSFLAIWICIAKPNMTVLRTSFAALLIVGVWTVAKSYNGVASLESNLSELMIIPLLVLLACVFRLNRNFLIWRSFAVIAVAAFVNVIGFGRFNPIQSALPLFRPMNKAILSPLDAAASRNPSGWITDALLPGAALAGLGYKSPWHVLVAPDLPFFRRCFPNMPEQEFQQVFNRSATIVLIPGLAEPLSLQPDQIRVPMHRFTNGAC